MGDLQISYPLPQEKEMVADLWQESFHDSTAYVELFFNRVYQPTNTLVIKRNGFIISALQMIPYKAKWEDKIIPVAYVCGVCTHPLERGKGLMKSLMRHAILELQKKGFHFAIVIPAGPSLFNYYRELGFTSLIAHGVENRKFDSHFLTVFEKENNFSFEECTNKHFSFFNYKQNERRSTILHDENDFETILQELNCCGDKAFVALHNHIPVGIAFAERLSDNTVLVKEITADNEKIQTALYQYISRVFDAHYVKIHVAAKSMNDPGYGLACNLDGQERELHFFNMSLMHD